MNVCNLNKKEGQKSITRSLGEKPLMFLIRKNKEKKKKRLREIEKGIEKEDKRMKNKVQISLISF